jgi:two-component system, cell cycle response regulator
MKVLIVDDDPVQRRILRAQLAQLGYEVRDVANGELAWRLLEFEPFPVVITDWMMPELDGSLLASRIRASQQASYTYVILLTARDQRSDVVAGLESGADDYLIKPVDPHELRARVAIAARIVNLETQLRAARDTDGLTQLLNRGAVSVAATREIARSERQRIPLGVLLLDLDHFKWVNDEYGHRAGDLALQTVARVVMANVRRYDIVGRWGGEELLVLLPGTSDAALTVVAERIRQAIERAPITLPDGQRITVTASIGAACSTSLHTPSPDELVQLADIALYRAKQHGRNRVVLFSGADEAETR